MKYAWLLPIIITACGTAPVTDPPAHALDVDENAIEKIMRYAEGYRTTVRNPDIGSMLNNALLEFNNGSNDPPKSEELLQLPSDRDQPSG